MLKNYIYLSLFIIIFANKAFALNSSSYLIANTAVNLFDFEEAYQQYNSSEKELGEYDSYNKLITLVNLKLIEKAKEVARDILEINKLNSEAWLVVLTHAKINNDYEASLLSTGQQKTIVRITLLALCSYLVNVKNKTPIILFDEIGSHLDSFNREILLDMINMFDIQFFLTGTDKNLFSFVSTNAQFYNITDL